MSNLNEEDIANYMEGDKMNFNRILNFIAENNIEPEQVFNLVEKVKRTDLSNENNIREIIHEVSKITNRPVNKAKEDEIVKKVVENGINEDLLNMF